jgi:hypothetical protein
MTQTSRSDIELAERAANLLMRLPPQSEWISYAEWNLEKQRMADAIRNIIKEVK